MAASGQTFVVVSDSVGFVGAFASAAEAQAALRPYAGIPFVYHEWRRREKAPPADGDEKAPPADGDEKAPPADGDEKAPPADGDEEAPPADGDEKAPPADGNEEAPPADGDEEAPPADGDEEAPPADGDEEAPPADGDEEDLVWILPYKNNAVACASNIKAVVETAQQELLRLDLVHDDDVKYWEAVVGTTIHAAQQRLDLVVEAMKAAPGDEKQNQKDAQTVSDFLDFAARDEPKEEPARINLLESVVPRALDV